MKKIALALALFVFGALAAHADWALNNDQSRLSFISVKKGSVAEVHHFTKLDGQVDGSGNVSVSIPLASVETAIPIRNERMQQMLFETEIFPSADLSAKVDLAAVESMSEGDVGPRGHKLL
jgi:polyisoprenoid-binding protein YceI